MTCGTTPVVASGAGEIVNQAVIGEASQVSRDSSGKIRNAIGTAAKTGKIGDGKVFVLSVEQATRIRTDETGEAAV